MPTNDHAREAAREIVKICLSHGASAIPIEEQVAGALEPYLAAALDDAKKERDELRDDYAAEVASLKELLSLSVKSDTTVLQALQRRCNDLAAINGRLVARLEAVRAWTPERVKRRAELIESKYSSPGVFTEREADELATLQELCGAYQDALWPLPTDEEVKAAIERSYQAAIAPPPDGERT